MTSNRISCELSGMKIAGILEENTQRFKKKKKKDMFKEEKNTYLL